MKIKLSDFTKIEDREPILVYVDNRPSGPQYYRDDPLPVLHIARREGDRGEQWAMEHSGLFVKPALRRVHVTNCNRPMEWVGLPHDQTSRKYLEARFRLCPRCGDVEVWDVAMAEIARREDRLADERRLEQVEREAERNWDELFDGIGELCFAAAKEVSETGTVILVENGTYNPLDNMSLGEMIAMLETE